MTFLFLLAVSGMDTVGLFRRTAAKASIESLKEQMEINPGETISNVMLSFLEAYPVHMV